MQRVARIVAEWAWRLALLAALGWIGLELHAVHIDLQPANDETTAKDSDDVLDSLDDLRDDLADLRQSLQALVAAISRAGS